MFIAQTVLYSELIRLLKWSSRYKKGKFKNLALMVLPRHCWETSLSKPLRSLSEIRVRNFCILKNKYDLTLCQSRLHTASETFNCNFLCFRILSKHFDGKGWRIWKKKINVLVSMVSWRTFNIHGTFPLHKSSYSGKSFFRLFKCSSY